jgi:hypothetical protein
MRAVAYARYSSDLQREASIEDQVRLCRKRIEQEGWQYLHAYTDRAVSGASALRPVIRAFSKTPAAASSTSSSPRRSIVFRAIRRMSPGC